MPSSIMSYPSLQTRPWVTRLWTAVSITGRGSEEQRLDVCPPQRAEIKADLTTLKLA